MSLRGPEHDAARRMRAIESLEQQAEEQNGPIAILRTLDEVVAERRVKDRDCRDCKNFNRDESGLNFGWCTAHNQYVKLYHPAGSWFSQCIFKGLRRFKPQELEAAKRPAVVLAGAGVGHTLLSDDGLEASIEERD